AIKLLAWVARSLGALKRVPLAPHLFDTLLLLWSALFARGVFQGRLALESEVARWPGVRLSPHPYGGTQFNLDGREIGHVHGNGVVDVHLPRALRDELVQAGRAQVHHTLPDSGWVSVPLRQ